MFFFKSDISHAVKLHAWMNTTIKTAFYKNQLIKPYLLCYSDQNGLQHQDYPLYQELQSVFYKIPEQCPYVAFQHNIFSQAYFMDKGITLTFWTQLVYLENTGLSIVVEHYGPNILTWTQEVSYEIASGFSTKSMVSWHFLFSLNKHKNMSCFLFLFFFLRDRECYSTGRLG